MGWESQLVAVEYDGDHPRLDRTQYVKDIRRAEMLEYLGWHVVRVIRTAHATASDGFREPSLDVAKRHHRQREAWVVEPRNPQPWTLFRARALGQRARVAQLRRVGDVAAFAFPRHVPAPTARARPTGDDHVSRQQPVAPGTPVRPAVRVQDEVVVGINSHDHNSDSFSRQSHLAGLIVIVRCPFPGVSVTWSIDPQRIHNLKYC